MRTPLLASLALWLLVGLTGARAQIVEELDNGLTVIVKENHTAPVAAFRIYVRAGSLYEQEWMGMGLTHVLEHLLSGGTTTTRSEAESAAIIDQLGGANNAYTTQDHTCYFIQTSSENIYTAIAVMSDWLQHATIPEAEYQREMGVVMEELNKGEEEPSRIISQALYDTMFIRHPVRVPVIGYADILAKITRQDVLDYYHRMYVPNNIVVVAAGDFDAQKVFDAIKAAWADFPRKPVPPITLPTEPRQLGKRERTTYKTGLGGAYGRIGFHSVPLAHDDLYALDVLSYILSNGRSSRLVQSVREEQGLVSSIFSYSHTPRYDAGMFVVGFNAENDKVAAAVIAISAELERVKTELVSDEELKKAKRQKLADYVFGLQTAEDDAADLAGNLISAGNVHFSELYLKGIRSVSAEDVRRVARTYLVDHRRSDVFLRPKAETTAAAGAPTASAADQPIRMVTLPNGLRLLVRRNNTLPIVSVQTSFMGGLRYEPSGQAGVSRLTAGLLTRGAGALSAEQIAATFDGMGGEISGSSGNNTIYLSMSTMTENFPEALSIYSQVLLNPTFPESQFQILQKQTLSAIARRRDDWMSSLSIAFRHNFFGDHPYANDPLGEVDTVTRLTPADVRSHYQATVVPERGVMAIFGDIDEETVITEVTRLFGQFTGQGAPPPTLPAPPILTENKIVFNAKPDSRISAVYFGYRGVDMNSDDIAALEVLDAVMSGVNYPSGWLQNALRGGNQDLVYLVHAFDWVGIEPGYFGIYSASSPQKMDKVIEIILQQVERARSSTVGDAELATAKAMCITMDKLARQTNSDIALQATLDELYGRGYDYSRTYEARINAVTADDLKRVANTYFTHYLLVREGPPPAAAGEADTDPGEGE